VRADWAAQRGEPTEEILNRALEKAEEARKSPATYPDAWQAVAETRMRLARREGQKAKQREEQIREGLAATTKIYGINANHAKGRGTEGELELLRAEGERDPAVRRGAAEAAVKAFEKEKSSDPLIARVHAAQLVKAKALVAAP
jgi:hypothetical protein